MRMLLLGMVIGFLAATLSVVAPLVLAQGAPPLQEFIPLPGLGPQPPGQEGGQDEECATILFYHNGQLYQLRPGPQGGPGRPGSPPEFFHLDPYRGPAIPGLPQPPSGPDFRPVLPRS